MIYRRLRRPLLATPHHKVGDGESAAHARSRTLTRFRRVLRQCGTGEPGQ
jgi:hypothetical protein